MDLNPLNFDHSLVLNAMSPRRDVDEFDIGNAVDLVEMNREMQRNLLIWRYLEYLVVEIRHLYSCLYHKY